jgi:hypothetical protein
MSCQPNAVEGSGRTRGAENRRATVRYQCAPATSGSLFVIDKHELQRAWVLNLSVGGVGLMVSRALEPGLFVVIRIKAPTDGRLHELPARVVHSTKNPSGDWIVGCQFFQDLTLDELDSLL